MEIKERKNGQKSIDGDERNGKKEKKRKTGKMEVTDRKKRG